MAYRSNDSGCGCLIALFIVSAIISGVRSCTEHLIDGDIKLPKFGSGHVSGGSGGYGTSNGYNVKYNQTISPNFNSSLRDYTHTNEQPTEYREGRNSQMSNVKSGNSSSYRTSGINGENSTLNSSPASSISGINSNIINTQKSKTYYKTCDNCNGKGVVDLGRFWFNGNENGNLCAICLRSDRHYHDREISCGKCWGTGKIIIEE